MGREGSRRGTSWLRAFVGDWARGPSARAGRFGAACIACAVIIAGCTGPPTGDASPGGTSAVEPAAGATSRSTTRAAKVKVGPLSGKQARALVADMEAAMVEARTARVVLTLDWQWAADFDVMYEDDDASWPRFTGPIWTNETVLDIAGRAWHQKDGEWVPVSTSSEIYRNTVYLRLALETPVLLLRTCTSTLRLQERSSAFEVYTCADKKSSMTFSLDARRLLFEASITADGQTVGYSYSDWGKRPPIPTPTGA